MVNAVSAGDSARGCDLDDAGVRVQVAGGLSAGEGLGVDEAVGEDVGVPTLGTWRRAPVLVLTAGSSPVQAALALAPGPVSFLVTPAVRSVTWTVPVMKRQQGNRTTVAWPTDTASRANHAGSSNSRGEQGGPR